MMILYFKVVGLLFLWKTFRNRQNAVKSNISLKVNFSFPHPSLHLIPDLLSPAMCIISVALYSTGNCRYKRCFNLFVNIVLVCWKFSLQDVDQGGLTLSESGSSPWKLRTVFHTGVEKFTHKPTSTLPSSCFTATHVP